MGSPYDKDAFDKAGDWLEERSDKIGWAVLQFGFYGGSSLILAGLLLGWPWMWGPGVLVALAAGVAAIEWRRMGDS